MRQLRVGRALAGDVLDHLSSEQEGLHLLQNLLPAVQHADSHRRKHLVTGECQKIDIQVLHVHRNVGHALGAVTYKHRSLLVSDRRKCLHIVSAAEHIGNLRHAHESGPWRQSLAEHLLRDGAVL